MKERATEKTNSKTSTKIIKPAKSKANYKLLSKREVDILFGLASGFLYKEMAEDYGISIDTVKKHCKNIYKKLEARNRTEAIKNSGAFGISFKKIRPTRK